MKKFTIITIMAMFTIMAVAQTSRRENNVSSTKKQEQKVTRTNSSNNSRTHSSNNNNKSNTSRTTRPENRSSSVSRNHEYKKPASSLPNNHNRVTLDSRPANTNKTTSSTKHNNSNYEYRNRSNSATYNKDRRASTSTRVTVRKNTAHSDVVYSSPRTNYRVHSYNPRYDAHYNHSYHYTKPYYRTPRRVNIVWNANMYHDYRIMYPFVNTWRISYGTRIETIPAYDADFHVGEVSRVYGKVKDVYYSSKSDEYFLYFGNDFPYQQFTVVIPGHEARKFSYRPVRFFDHEYITVTGYISEFEGRPEMLVSKNYQIDIY